VATTVDELTVEETSTLLLLHKFGAGGGLAVIFCELFRIEMVGRAGSSSAALPHIKNPSSLPLHDNPQRTSRISSYRPWKDYEHDCTTCHIGREERTSCR
jgi:hypothetical protein